MTFYSTKKHQKAEELREIKTNIYQNHNPDITKKVDRSTPIKMRREKLVINTKGREE
ncbi:MAG: hypothetical protein F6K54_15470 [Okeania sp. SIO3B5]|uniref:hypothetical protein n=1 Tax=Okeania sp. SIO3B5 TaxID=2607811 RepID=UPI0014010034|nr:hypothetical protein [Okeania sp. SIO3B5]NEO54359.1 hypothetical protein [Okeania sp. SIO3B5]